MFNNFEVKCIMNDKKQQIWFIQALRGASALTVMISHLVFMFYTGGAAGFELLLIPKRIDCSPVIYLATLMGKARFSLGNFGVVLFFLITGFVATIARKPIGGGYKYLIKRILRVYPLYIIGFSITFYLIRLYTSWRGIAFPYSMSDYLVQASLLRDWFWKASIDGVSWTLEAQLKFYVLIAFLFRKLKYESIRSLSFVSIALTIPCIVLPLMYNAIWQLWAPLLNISRAIVFSAPWLIIMLVGVCFYNYHKEKWSVKQLIVSLSLLMACFYAGIYFGTKNETWLIFFVSPSAALLVFCIVFLFRKVIPYCRFFDFFGKISYPLYIIHGLNGYILMTFLDVKFSLNPYISMGIAMTCTVLLAYILHILIEKPLGNLIKQIERRLPGHGVAQEN